MSQYYDGTKLLSMKDLEGKTPEIFLCTSNRSAGKTTYFNRLAFKRFLKEKRKFALLYRFNYELDDVADKYFKDINGLFFPNYNLISKRKASGIYHELFTGKINEPTTKNYDSCGYALSLNSADQLKKYSHLFSDVDMIIFDEFMSETNHYCSDEVKKLLSIHTTIARGQSKLVRYVPIIMISNPVSLINPYYIELGIASRLKNDTKFLKGNGFVLEQGYSETASQAQLGSGVNRAFAKSDYVAYASQGVYLNDNLSFVDNMTGRNRYMATLKYNGTDYAVRSYDELGLVYVNYNVDNTYPVKIVVTTDDHELNYIMLRKNSLFLTGMRSIFEKGCFRFKDLQCKEATLSALAI